MFFTLHWGPALAIDEATKANSVEILGFSGPTFSKLFTFDQIAPDNISTLIYTIDNSASGTPVTDLAFSDVLPAEIRIFDPPLISNDCQGSTSTNFGAQDTFSLTDGAVGGGTICTISIDVTSNSIGTHTSTSGALTSSEGSGGTASDDLTVASDRPTVTKSFSPTTVDIGGRSTLTFIVNNPVAGLITLSSIIDNFPVGMELADPVNATIDCLSGTITAVPGTSTLTVNSIAFTTAGSCTFSVDVKATGAGTLINSTENMVAFFGGTLNIGKTNAALESNVADIILTKEFLEDPIPAGSTVAVEYTILNFNRLESATNISFTDDFDGLVSGLSATGTPQSNVCGGTLSGTGILSLSGGSLAPEASCTFSATLTIPPMATTGAFPSMTSAVSATVGGSPTTGTMGQDTLHIEPGPILTKEYITTPLAAGDDVIARYTITNSSQSDPVTDVSFDDIYTNFLPFPLTAVLPGASPCGGGSTVTLTVPNTDVQAITLTGGNIPAGDSCTFDVTLTVPVGVASGSYLSELSDITGTVDSEIVSGNSIVESLQIVSAPTFRKSFTNDPVLSGETVTLEYTIEHGVEEPAIVTNLSFTDDMEAVISGLISTSGTQNDVCGAGSQISGTSTLSFTGGQLAPGETCTFSVELQLPTPLLPGTNLSVSSSLTGDHLRLDGHRVCRV